MKKILLILIILICIGGIVGAAYTYNKYSDSLMNDDTEEPTQKPTEDPSTCKHTKDVVLPAVEATCYKSGYTEGRMCSDCGTMLIEQEVVVKLPHTPEIIPSEQSTCITHGHGAGSKCSVCHEVLVTPEELPLADHTPYTVPEIRSTCIEQGTSSYYKCSVCQTNITNPSRLPLSEHDFSGYIEGAEATCTTDGFSSSHYCIICGTNETEIITYPALGHLEVVVHPITEPTCISVGYTAEICCDRCGYTVQTREEIPMTEHTRVEIAGKASTCNEAGYTVGYKCGKCETVLVEQEPLPLAAHTLVTIPKVAATCTSTGLTEGKRCSICNTVTVEQETINKTPHTYVAMETLAADCGNNGRSGGTECSRCGAWGDSPTFTPALGHYYGDNFENPCDRCNGYLGEDYTLSFTQESSTSYKITSSANSSDITMIIPSKYNNVAVKTISSGGIVSTKVETILVGSNITHMGLNAIQNCTKLKAVFIPDNVQYVEAAAIVGCSNLTDVYVQFKEGYLPEGWNTNWAMGLPDGCTIHYLSPDAVTYGFDYSLNSNGDGYVVTGLDYKSTTDKSFKIPTKHNGLPVTEIASGAFDKVYGIQEISVPSSVTTIGDSAFEFCYDLQKVIFAGKVKLGVRAFASCLQLKTVNTVNIIEMGEYCFLETGLTVVELSPNLATIPQYAFYSCNYLTSVYINEGTTIILDKAFMHCEALTNIYLPNGLEHIATGVFGHCYSLESIYIPETVIKMGVTLSGNGRGNVFYTTGTLIINCGADSQPSGWYDGWNVSETDPDTDEILARYTTNWGQAR